jgi:hypothetical protein
MRRAGIPHAPEERGSRTAARYLLAALCLYLILGLVAGPGIARAQGPDAGQEGARATFAYSRDPNTVVLSFTEFLGAIEDPDPGPTLRVYGDGRVVVHYPPYMARAGDYEFELSRAEMEGLFRSLIEKEVVEFDEAAARRSVRETAAGPAELFAVLDASTTQIDLRLDRYKPAAGRGPERLGVEKRISWYGLQAHARRFPGAAVIQKLAAARGELVALRERGNSGNAE